MQNHIVVIFGASGDLTYRKLIPALFDLYVQNLLPERFFVLGLGRSKLSDEDFKAKMSEGIAAFSHHWSSYKDHVSIFCNSLAYKSMDPARAEDYLTLSETLSALSVEQDIPRNFLFYLATPPILYAPVAEHLASVGLNKSDDGFVRLIIEKPFGYDLSTAIALNKRLSACFDEEQLYRIDHYLGKETVQNVFVTRFSNGIFEPLWNRNYIEFIEITSAESIGVEGRGGYYDRAGALRDMAQNHLLQVAALVAMEPPSLLNSTAIRDETMKVFESVRRLKKEEVNKYVVRGQYMESQTGKGMLKSYRDEEGVAEDSKTETFFAMQFMIDNWRWAGVPFYLRTGKRMPTRVTEIVIHFKPTPHSIFKRGAMNSASNQLVIRIQPDEGLLLKLGMKVPGAGYEVQEANLDFHYADMKHGHVPEAYERLLLDSMQGDSTLYARGDAVMKAWELMQPILDAWEEDESIPVYGYAAGTWGPEAAFKLLQKAGFTWRYPCKNLANDGVYCEL